MALSGAVAARLLIVDDEPENIRFLKKTVRDGGYHRVRSTRSPLAPLDIVAESQPDLILLDLHMPDLDGFGVLARLRSLLAADTYLPVLMLTGDTSAATRKAALAAGVKDFLTKPFDADEVRLRIGNLLETRQFYLRLREQNASLEVRVAGGPPDRPDVRGTAGRQAAVNPAVAGRADGWSSGPTPRRSPTRPSVGCFKNELGPHLRKTGRIPRRGRPSSGRAGGVPPAARPGPPGGGHG